MPVSDMPKKTICFLLNKEKFRQAGHLHPPCLDFPYYCVFFNRKIKKYGSPLYHGLPHFVTKNRNFDRNLLRGCNFGSEGVQFTIEGGAEVVELSAVSCAFRKNLFHEYLK